MIKRLGFRPGADVQEDADVGLGDQRVRCFKSLTERSGANALKNQR